MVCAQQFYEISNAASAFIVSQMANVIESGIFMVMPEFRSANLSANLSNLPVGYVRFVPGTDACKIGSWPQDGKWILGSVCYQGCHGRALTTQVGFHLNDGERIEAEIYDTLAACEAAPAKRA